MLLQLDPFRYTENYSDSSICVDGIYSAGCITHDNLFCVAQATYTVNGSNRYALQFESMNVHAFVVNYLKINNISCDQMKTMNVKMDML